MPKPICIDLVEDNGFIYTVQTDTLSVEYWLDIIDAAGLLAGVVVRGV